MIKLPCALASVVSILLLAACSNGDRTNSAKDTTSAKITRGSIYDINLTLENQYGEKVEWQSLRGKARVMAMIFTHCPSACPMITMQIKSVEARIPASAKAKVGYTLVSFDTKRDTAARLREFYDEQHLDTNWELLHGSADDVRTIAALLNVQYKEWPTGDFTHSDVTFVIDPDGQIVLRQEGIALENQKVVFQTINKLLGLRSN